MKTARERILCPGCLRIRRRTRHHIFPQEYFGKQNNGPFLYLCAPCHQELERIIHVPSLTKREIVQLTQEFICIEEVP